MKLEGRSSSFVPGRGLWIALLIALVGWGLTGLGFVIDARRTFFAYLAAYSWAVTLSLGALGFLATVHAMGATWPVALRRLMETASGGLLPLLVMFAPIFVGMKTLYPWLSLEQFTEPHVHELVKHRTAYYNVPFYVGRWVVVFAVWLVFAVLLWRWSLRQDRGRGDALRLRMRTLSGAALVPLGLTATIASYDWLMSLTPTWYSTMYGFYFIAACLLGGTALTTVLAAVATGSGFMPELKRSHYHALGRCLLAFVILWAYTAFFQFMLIWIANLPAEGEWFVQRQVRSWLVLSIILVVGKFAIPFFYLLSHRLKRGPIRLALVAGWILFFQYVDMYWLVMPALNPAPFSPSWIDAVTLLAVAASTWTFGLLLARGRPLVPIGDPSLEAAYAYESL